MDCNVMENYYKERERMCENTFNIIDKCDRCALGSKNNEMNMNCFDFRLKHISKAIKIVQEWSDKHPQKTILEDFLEKHPNALFNDIGTPQKICPYMLGYGYNCNNCDDWELEDCIECWNKPV